MNTVTVKCVICKYTWGAPLSDDEPMCPHCMGPVTVVEAETSAQPAGKEAKP